MNLNSPIREIKGIGVKTEQLFQQLGVYTVGDILLYFPRDYEKYPALCEVEQLLEDRKNALYICVKKSPTVNTHSRQQVALLDVKGENEGTATDLVSQSLYPFPDPPRRLVCFLWKSKPERGAACNGTTTDL